MNDWVWCFAVVVSALFFIAMVVITICQWVIYYRIEKTTLKQRKVATFRKHDEPEVNE
ncbi:hypothetical protein [Bifidobacterium aquikefiricola]|uniref:Uncharacterized protein n=1 Tax=Bifidobacterium aquikefiricola TaxID=3059038 RepID=A0AB39U7S9_9BIFI